MIKFSLAFCCVMAGPVLAQNAAQNAPQAESGPTIHATVNEVALDLVVRDKKGRLVKNLKPGDVEIYEDGVRQDIRSLRLVGSNPKRLNRSVPWRCRCTGSSWSALYFTSSIRTPAGGL